MNDLDAFVERCARNDDAAAFLEALRTVPDHDWPTVHARMVERLDNEVPGEPTPPLHEGEETGREVLSAAELAEDTRTIEGKRAILAREDQARRARA
jgi:hypothetical protein